MMNEDAILTEDEVAMKDSLLRLLTSNTPEQVELGLQLQEGLQYPDIQLAIDTITHLVSVYYGKKEFVDGFISFKRDFSRSRRLDVSGLNGASMLLLGHFEEATLSKIYLDLGSKPIDIFDIAHNALICIKRNKVAKHYDFGSQISKIVKHNRWVKKIQIEDENYLHIDKLCAEDVEIGVSGKDAPSVRIGDLSQSDSVTITSNKQFENIDLDSFLPPKNRFTISVIPIFKAFEQQDFDEIVNAIATFNATCQFERRSKLPKTICTKLSTWAQDLASVTKNANVKQREGVYFSPKFIFTERNPRLIYHDYFVEFWNMVKADLVNIGRFIDHTTSGLTTLTIVLTNAPDGFYRMCDSLGVVVRVYNRELDKD